ncbi:MAG: hypothetical protein O9315_17920 [Beijerinckiaceae bacterium]|nr:hypothetical protein [Brevundimonas sp.]MCZ8302118.1 hypothetical protein [Beijerinckiaceae bacterium]
MKPSLRVMILLIVIELGLAGLWWYLLDALRTGELRPARSLAETVDTISVILGSAMGLVGGLLLVIWFVLRRRNR